MLFSAVLFVNYPYLHDAYFPIHDTMEVFTFIHYFYSQWFLNNEIPQWFPYITYGLPANIHQFTQISPVYYFVMFLSAIFKIKNALFVFKLGVLIEQFIFIGGIYSLSNLLYKKESTRMLVSLILAFTIIWFNGINYNFRFYFLFPWVIQFIINGFNKQNNYYFFKAILFVLLGYIGITLYFIGFWIFLYFSFFIIYGLLSKSFKFSLCKFNKKSFLMLLGIIFLIIFIGLYLKNASNYLVMTTTQRQADGGISLQTFLTYDRHANISMILRELFFPLPSKFSAVAFDNNLYVGLFPIFLLLWSFLSVRNKYFYSFVILGLLLILFSMGGRISTIVYYFPGMKYYRHIALIYGFVKILIVLCAGFGFENLIQSKKSKIINRSILIFALIFLLFLSFPLLRNLLYETCKPNNFYLQLKSFFDFSNIIFIQDRKEYFFISIFFFFFLFILSKNMKLIQNSKKMILIIFFFVICDLLIYQLSIYKYIPHVNKEDFSKLYAVNVNNLDYQPRRSLDLNTKRHNDAYDLIMLNGPTAKYVTSYNFVQFDRCDPGFRVDFVNEGLIDFLSIPGMKSVMTGCNFPKIRLVPNAIYYNDKIKAAIGIKFLDEFYNTVILTSDDYEKEFVNIFDIDRDIKNYFFTSIKIIKFKPNYVKIDVDIPVSKGMWLVYTDAYNPNWKVFIDAQESKLYKAYFAFKSVFVPNGQHIIEFQYSPSSIRWSYLLAVIGLISGFYFIVKLVKLVLSDSTL